MGQDAERPSSRTLVVEDGRVQIRGFATLPPALRQAVTQVLDHRGLAALVDGGGELAGAPAALVVPRFLDDDQGRHDMARLLGECLRPASRHAAAAATAARRAASRLRARRYPERLDAELVLARAHALADLIEARRARVVEVLLRYETFQVAEDELARTLDLLRHLHENRATFVRRLGEIAVFLPMNQPLYALACFALVPALMARRVHLRPPTVMGEFFQALLDVLDLEARFPELCVSRLPRRAFVAERARIVRDGHGERRPATDAVIFTGTPGNAAALRAAFSRDVLVIANGAGHNPLVISETADMPRAIASALRVQLYNQGQDCASPSAILVHQARHAELLAGLRAALATVRVGPYADRDVRVGPLSRRRQLVEVQATLVAHAAWLDPATPGVIRTRDGVVEPTIIDKPLALGGNYTEHFAPIFVVQRYDDDTALAAYFDDPRYARHAMYVTLFGASATVDALLTRRDSRGQRLHDAATILRDTDLHAPGVERGTQPYGGYGVGASSVSLHGETVARPTLPQRELFELLVAPTLADEA